jgi:hypothetical protein
MERDVISLIQSLKCKELKSILNINQGSARFTLGMEFALLGKDVFSVIKGKYSHVLLQRKLHDSTISESRPRFGLD